MEAVSRIFRGGSRIFCRGGGGGGGGSTTAVYSGRLFFFAMVKKFVENKIGGREQGGGGGHDPSPLDPRLIFGLNPKWAIAKMLSVMVTVKTNIPVVVLNTP